MKSETTAPVEEPRALPYEKAMISKSHPAVASPSGKAGRFAAALRILEEAIAARAFPGCAFGVLADGKAVLQGAMGRFTYEEDAPPVAAETIYDVASLTKVVATTATAMLLVERKQLDLDTPLGELLPGFVAGRNAADLARTVTLRHLLAHNSGLPGYIGLFRTASTPDALFRACLELPLQAEPGTRAEYSDPGFILLGKALEVLIGEDLASWTRREVSRTSGHDSHPLLSAARSEIRNPSHRRGRNLPPSPHSGRSAGRKRMGDERRCGTRRSLLQYSRPAALLRRNPAQRKGHRLRCNAFAL